MMLGCGDESRGGHAAEGKSGGLIGGWHFASTKSSRN
jgi:hypothetical protein